MYCVSYINSFQNNSLEVEITVHVTLCIFTIERDGCTFSILLTFTMYFLELTFGDDCLLLFIVT